MDESKIKINMPYTVFESIRKEAKELENERDKIQQELIKTNKFLAHYLVQLLIAERGSNIKMLSSVAQSNNIYIEIVYRGTLYQIGSPDSDNKLKLM